LLKAISTGKANTPAMPSRLDGGSFPGTSAGQYKWEYRRKDNSVFADFHDGTFPAPSECCPSIDRCDENWRYGGEIFYLSATAYGLTKQGMNDQSIQYADRAIANRGCEFGRRISDSRAPGTAIAMVQAGQSAQHKKS